MRHCRVIIAFTTALFLASSSAAQDTQPAVDVLYKVPPADIVADSRRATHPRGAHQPEGRPDRPGRAQQHATDRRTGPADAAPGRRPREPGDERPAPHAGHHRVHDQTTRRRRRHPPHGAGGGEPGHPGLLARRCTLRLHGHPRRPRGTVACRPRIGQGHGGRRRATQCDPLGWVLVVRRQPGTALHDRAVGARCRARGGRHAARTERAGDERQRCTRRDVPGPADQRARRGPLRLLRTDATRARRRRHACGDRHRRPGADRRRHAVARRGLHPGAADQAAVFATRHVGRLPDVI